MAMKQTQTKLFEFSDVGLDFNSGSKNLFPDRFKKILALGYNIQTVSSVAILGNQVTLTYGGAHGYVADRVLKVDSGALTSINSGEFWINSITTNTVTFTLDNAPSSVSGGFTTRIAPLGWQKVYEQANIYIYKMKHIDDADRYVRFCFQDGAKHRNAIAICIGKSFDEATGFIDDIGALQATKDILSPSAENLPRWDFALAGNNSAFNDQTFMQGVGTFGRGVFIGSPYHFAMLNHSFYYPQFNAILPVSVCEYEILQYPILLCTAASSSTAGDNTAGGGVFANSGISGRAYLGGVRCRFDCTGNVIDNTLNIKQNPKESVLSASIDDFNTTTCINIPIYEHSTSQFLGYCLGAYFVLYANDAAPPGTGKTAIPSLTIDIDLNNRVVVHEGAGAPNKAQEVYVAMPIEEIKID